ncbi:DNA topoisomerase I [Pseudoalteromonas tunicata D2]|uniref:DNA topoisomerase I n=1 Tax=Pseudoalteromonas tunicata D2 TaxID=87626 RepID=A4CBL1_9GAMM|nr:DNA topoisomerase I [Pseudoalteromonas tunicata D2]
MFQLLKIEQIVQIFPKVVNLLKKLLINCLSHWQFVDIPLIIEPLMGVIN